MLHQRKSVERVAQLKLTLISRWWLNITTFPLSKKVLCSEQLEPHVHTISAWFPVGATVSYSVPTPSCRYLKVTFKY